MNCKSMNKKEKILISLASLLWLATAHAVPAEETDAKAAPDTPPASAEQDADMSGLTGSYLSGQFARLSGDIDGAIHYLRQVHRKDPTNTTVAGQLQGLLLMEGKVDEATALVHTGKQLEDGSDQLDALLMVLRDVKQHHWDEAASRLDNASATGSGQLWQPLLSAWVDVERGKLIQAVALKDLGGDLSRAAPLVNYHLALINNRGGFKDAAAANFKAAVEDPKNPPPRVMRGRRNRAMRRKTARRQRTATAANNRSGTESSRAPTGPDTIRGYDNDQDDQT